MSDLPLAVAAVPPPRSDLEYEAISTALMETARGRWFLHEYAQRNRNADTGQVLTALERIEGVLRDERPTAPVDRLRDDVVDMAELVAGAKQDIATFRSTGQLSGQAGEGLLTLKMMLLLRDLEQRIGGMLETLGAAPIRAAATPSVVTAPPAAMRNEFTWEPEPVGEKLPPADESDAWAPAEAVGAEAGFDAVGGSLAPAAEPAAEAAPDPSLDADAAEAAADALASAIALDLPAGFDSDETATDEAFAADLARADTRDESWDAAETPAGEVAVAAADAHLFAQPDVEPAAGDAAAASAPWDVPRWPARPDARLQQDDALEDALLAAADDIDQGGPESDPMRDDMRPADIMERALFRGADQRADRSAARLPRTPFAAVMALSVEERLALFR
jgi:hypothetical protein